MEEKLIQIRWHVDRSREPAVYMLVCDHPDHRDLQVSLSSADVTERTAKARLMQMMYDLGEQQGLPGSRLRFKINGIDE